VLVPKKNILSEWYYTITLERLRSLQGYSKETSGKISARLTPNREKNQLLIALL